MLWVKRFFQQLGMKQERYDIHCDSQSALDLSKNAMYHSRTKHIDVRYHWLRQVVEEQLFKLEKIHTDKNPGDMMMTKVVIGGKLQLCAKMIGMECM
ncbi:cysteine-rich RLK (RECEPTOR-like protein kinase) 8 [Striga hermonthica]|uniref:Cysteine-rich RLK (RECEPTOR-like protein kinase) 8 n=1 Tax=Striga hermonthica TaxID=68872 RepID=A0A9N7N0S9_STRHE|nr:cysteine-rich RLK (RECEPTOR-like protein kinase) 8 [Striga hermonthica]